MKKTKLCTIGIRTACALSMTCMLSACGSAADSGETAALRQEIADLQQQITELQQADTAAAPVTEQPAADTQTPSADTSAAPADNTQTPPADAPAAPAQQAAESQPPADNTQTAPAAGDTTAPAPAGSGADTMESLTTLTDDFASRVATLLAGSANPELEQFFTYKQEAESIDRRLDQYEDELERQVRGGSLSRDDYRSAERELEKLEDALDKAEDQLEYYFGIDD